MPRRNPNATNDVVTPSIRKIFVKHARKLKRKPAFLRALQEQRTAWNLAWPRFAIGQLGPPPAEQFWLPNDFPIPPPLARASEEYNRLLAARRPIEEKAAIGEPVHGAFQAWRTILIRLCEAWWPADVYPNWVCPWEANPIIHPAWNFLAACLVWQPTQVPEEWIRAYGLTPVARNYDPSNPEGPGRVVFYRALCERLYTTLADAFADSPDQMALLESAARDAFRAAVQAQRARGETREPDRWFVPLYPGLTSTDWQRFRARAIARANSEGLGRGASEGGNMATAGRRRRARQLWDDPDYSLREISDLLGLSPRQTGRLIHGK
jgi:hypothetical protein